MNYINNIEAALILIDIAYKKGELNETTYNNIIKKYSKKESPKTDSLVVFIKQIFHKLYTIFIDKSE